MPRGSSVAVTGSPRMSSSTSCHNAPATRFRCRRMQIGQAAETQRSPRRKQRHSSSAKRLQFLVNLRSMLVSAARLSLLMRISVSALASSFVSSLRWRDLILLKLYRFDGLGSWVMLRAGISFHLQRCRASRAA